MTGTQYNHARFWKCALQVNPHGYSKRYRGQDHGMSAEAYTGALLEKCRQNDIEAAWTRCTISFGRSAGTDPRFSHRPVIPLRAPCYLA